MCQFLKMTMFSTCVGFFIIYVSFGTSDCDARRPFYLIGHMANSIEEISMYLDGGANMVEIDIQFHANGSVKEISHGFPCDCCGPCSNNANLQKYLEHVRDITDPLNTNYSNQMVMVYFDLKLRGSGNKKVSGREVAKHVLDYLWSKDGRRNQQIRALMYIESIKNIAFIKGFIKEFKKRCVEERLKDIGFDGGEDDFDEIQLGLSGLVHTGNIWQGMGKTNWISMFYPDFRLRKALKIRDSQYSYIKKVYHWTIDITERMRLSLNASVDGMITNEPKILSQVLNEPYYRERFRLATPDDDPFARYEGD